MSTGRPIAVYDANVLYSASLRDLFIRLGRAGLVAPRWSDAIHEEWIGNLLRNLPDLTREQLERTRALMEAALPGALVRGYERRIARLRLPDPGDRHVLAAAIEARAEVIVTFNTRDFPPAALGKYGVRAVHPDEFVLSLTERDPDGVVAAVQAARSALHHPPRSAGEYLATLERAGLHRTADWLRARADEL